MIRQHSLQNGTRVLMETVPTTEVVSLGFWFLHGSRDEKEENKGYSHFLEHMLFKGTEKRTSFEIVQEIDRVGGILNAFTEKEQTCYYCTLAAEHQRLAVDVLTDMVFHSLLKDDDILREKQVIINEIKESLDNPEERAYEMFTRSLFGEHPIADKITGEIEHIERITRESLVQFYHEHYCPSNLIISIAGNFEPEELLDNLSATLPERYSSSFTHNRMPPESTYETNYVSGNFKQVQLFTGTTFTIPSEISHFYHFLVFSTAVGESMSSRLFQRIREQEGLCYSIFALRSFFTFTALWGVYANTSPHLLNKLMDSLTFELEHIFTNLLEETEIGDAISHLVGSMKLTQEDMETRMKRLVRHYILGKEIHDMETSISILQETTRKDIQHFFDTYFSGKKFNSLIFGTRNLHKRKQRGIMV